MNFSEDGKGICPICQQEIEDFEIPEGCTGDCGCAGEIVPDYAMSPEKELNFNVDERYDMQYGDIVDDVVRVDQDDEDADLLYVDDDYLYDDFALGGGALVDDWLPEDEDYE